MIKIGIGGIALTMLSACGNGTPDYDATGTFEATEVIVSAEVAGKLLNLDIEEGKRLQTGEEIGLVDTLQLYLKKLQLEANMKSVESQRPDLAKQIAATKQQIATAEREKKRVENLLTAGAANQKQLDDWDAQVKLLERQLAAQESSLLNSTNSLTEQGNSVAIQVAQVKDQLNKCHIQSPIAVSYTHLYSVLAQPFHKFEVYILRLQTAVYQDKEVCHLFPFQDIIFDYGTYLVFSFLSATGVSISRKVDQIPVLVNKKVVD